MRLMRGRSKDPTYHVIQDVCRNGKRSTEIIENLGYASEICEKYHVTDADKWAENYIKNLRETEAAKDHRVLVPFNISVIIDADKRLSFNVGYLFLQRIIYCQLGLPYICSKIKKKNFFEYDLDSILSRLIYRRILFPSSKLSCYEQSGKLLE